MPTFEILCKDCKATLIASDLTLEDYDKAWCAECKSQNLELIGFSQSDEPAYYLLEKEIEKMRIDFEGRIEVLEDLILDRFDDGDHKNKTKNKN